VPAKTAEIPSGSLGRKDSIILLPAGVITGSEVFGKVGP